MNYETYSLGIDEVRKIIKIIEIKDSNRKPINISFYMASEEAQNAMLKMLEDYEGSQFVINVPSREVLLPTVRSRLIDITDLKDVEGIDFKSIKGIQLKGNLLIIKKEKDGNNSEMYEALVNKYIKMTVMDRLKCKELEQMLAKETDTGLKNKEIKSKDDIHQFLIAVVNRLLEIYKEQVYAEEKNILNKKENLKEQINQFNTLAEYMIKPGSSAKIIMEYVAYRLKV